MSDYEKVICCDRGGSNDNFATAMMANNGMNGQWNNPFIYLVWMMFAQRMWGNGYGEGGNNPQIAALQNQMQDNQNSNMIIDAIKGNSAQVAQLASNLNCDVRTLSQAICDVRNSIQQVGGQVGFSAERVINAVNMGDSRVTEAINQCCCNTQKELIRMQGDLRLSTCEQTNALQRGQADLANSISKGFSATAFETQKQTCDIVNNANANTQRIIDTLNSHWRDELSQQNLDLKFKVSQFEQTQNIVNQLKGDIK